MDAVDGRKRFQVLATGLAISMLLAVFLVSAEFHTALLVAAVATLLVVVLTMAPFHPPPVEECCHFCGMSRQDVKWLVAGNHASICERCVAYSLAHIDVKSSKPGNLDTLRDSISAIVDLLHRKFPREELEVLLAAAVALSRTPEERRRYALAGITWGHPQRTVELLEGIPPLERGAPDVVTLAVAHAEMDDYTTALTTLHTLDAAVLSPLEKALVQFNAAWMEHRARKDLTTDEVVKLLGAAEKAGASLVEHCAPEHRSRYNSRVSGACAEMMIRLGNLEGATVLVGQALTETPDEPDLLRILGEAQAAKGDRGQAVAAWRKAKQLAVAGTGCARELEKLLPGQPDEEEEQT